MYCVREYENYKSLLHESFANVSGRVSFTSDLWTACNNCGFLTLTAHYVDDSWSLRSKILNFRYCGALHTGVDVRKSMDVMVEYLKKELMQSSPLPCNGKFFHCAFNGKLCLDVVTRWSSTYTMLRKALEAKEALLLFTNRYLGIYYRLDADEWDTIQNICDFLQPFYDITVLFSSVEYPTANLYFVSVLRIEYVIYQAHKDLKLSPMATVMLKKFEGYWEHYSLILSIVVALDPSYKLY
ncbi:zinc finger BED domain-containing protein RICESLEEPER 1-like [Chenopodium quinoa]|uniref:zinc finger BED domain-containing protein RICESLEEPER 1-like n=1 Tax=Chenopodium quinoa TaxID=63459 RepID=UPI000B7838E4|nr:zinc finger BED domain-containing protein RICESLEEPER 1-like [Chenopodium quinoa]